ncbi:LysR family transcriptional regulator [Candidatus Amarobacter glycogenicus]|uniref:LysR family transcriptional regulator n=1 Tax=Candidatus Amarobacter glycogenicus TaxID=3140699 RepID=UPI002A0BB151|nr:LysR family transcriptional regulator [Dehalococcoidia bacterium]
MDSQKAYVELHHLRYLRAVVRTGSVTAAAEAEFVAQPSVSKQLRALEKELGVPLFHRVGRRVVPTGAALALADCADRVFDEIAATVAAVSGPESPLGESLRMCATETVSDNLLPRALAELGRRHSRCHILVEMLGTDDAIERVLADEFDLAIVVLPLADSRLDIHSLLTEEVLLAVGPGHRWASFASIALREVLEEPDLLLSMPGLGLRSMVDEAARDAGVELRTTFELRSQQAILALVASGGGIALSPRMSVDGRDDVIALGIVPPLNRQIGWIRRKGRHLPRIAEELLGLLVSP